MNYPFGTEHPLGEDAQALIALPSSRVAIDTYGGRVHVEWDREASLTPMGQLGFFIEFLKTTKLFDELVAECPLSFSSNNSSSVRDILGSMMLSVLAGHTRYSHVTALRNEQVNAQLLGMNKIVSEDVIRRFLIQVDEREGVTWLENNLKKCYEHLLSIPWILDLDATVKVLYGKQEGAEVGYNPRKPGRPAHIYHSYFIANIRMALNVDVHNGKEIAGCYSKETLLKFLDALPQLYWPHFIRGDISYGTENFIQGCEEKGVHYLFKVKCTGKIKAKIKYHMERTRRWKRAGHGYEGVEDTICLDGWSNARRIIILRRKLENKEIGILKKTKDAESDKQLSLFEFAEIDQDTTAYEYAVLVTDLTDEIMTIAQHYRDRGDSENNFDELKNQWGWCGFTTQDMKRCQLTAKFIALIYDWWTIFVRLIEPNHHREAVTTRPLLLSAVGKLTEHGREKKLTITSTHAKNNEVAKILSGISHFFKTLQSVAEQLQPKIILCRILEKAFGNFFGKPVNFEAKMLLGTG